MISCSSRSSHLASSCNYETTKGVGDTGVLCVKNTHFEENCPEKGRRQVTTGPVFSTEKFQTCYKVGKELGRGAFSVVSEATKRKRLSVSRVSSNDVTDCSSFSADEDNAVYAVKTVTKAELTRDDETALLQEIDILRDLSNHPTIVDLYEVFQERDHYYLVMEKMEGGELFDRIIQKQFYSEKDARDLCVSLFEAIKFCHKRKIAHRDLKPENLLLRSNANDCEIKIADFGFAKRCLEPKSLVTQCGTTGYVAPEVLRGDKYDMQCDMWSLGVIIYTILGGYSPFDEPSNLELIRKIRSGDYEFHAEYWDPVSKDAKKLIKKLLKVNPDKRYTAKKALKSKWIATDAAALASHDLANNLNHFRLFCAKRKFKIAINAIIAANKLKEISGSIHVPPPLVFAPGKFQTSYKIGKELGRGAYSIVKEASKRKTLSSRHSITVPQTIAIPAATTAKCQSRNSIAITNPSSQNKSNIIPDDEDTTVYAVKQVTKAELSRDNEASLLQEIDILRELSDHPTIVMLNEVYQDRDHYYLVMEKMDGGELFDRIIQKQFYNEKDARDLCVILFEAIQYCHSHKVAHRDLKPENLLLRSNANDCEIKIADFGFAKRCYEPKSLLTQCGTAGYVAPEVLKGEKYDTQCDMWSLGVIIYTLLGGYCPFDEPNPMDVIRKIRNGDYEFHPQYWDNVSKDAKKLIKRLLRVDPDERYTAKKALKSKWITTDASALATRDLGNNLSQFRLFCAKRKFKIAINAIIAANKLKELSTSNHSSSTF